MAEPPSPQAVAAALARWWSALGWSPLAFQREVWAAMQQGQSGLLHATTGAGKTYAVWLGALMALAGTRGGGAAQAPPLTVLWITPMRALAADTLRALDAPLAALREQASAAGARPGEPTPDPGAALARWTLGLRTGDSSSAERSAQARRLPTALVTTPESLSLMLARADASEVLGAVRLVVVDEWHELLGSKRGVQVQLALARLQALSRAGAGPLVWALSATLGNLQEALACLLGPGQPGRLVQAQLPKALQVDTLLPATAERFAWAGHLGLRMLPQVVAELEGSPATLVFTNTRSQAELWYQALLQARPDWAGQIALHHGSLARETREWVEQELKKGQLKAVVCTSSLDLGVDFLPVARVLQIGSPKGVARLLQRAGRSGHAPGRPSRITLVPTHSLELIEGAAARAAVAAGQIESRRAPQQPLDVLVQHLVTVALGGGFEPQALYAEVRRTAAYAQLTPEAWQWCLDFVQRGGPSLAAYPAYRRVLPGEDGRWRVPDAGVARRHRMNIGTIVSDAHMTVAYVGGARLGQVEESFIARMRPGDRFVFAGRLLELVRVHEMTAQVQRATSGRPNVPRWSGGRMPLSTTLADAVVAQLALADAGHFDSPELALARPLLALQKAWSRLPVPGRLLAETLKSREGWHLFLYPFAGRQAHLGLAHLLAWRAAQISPGTFSLAFNDYGFELLSATERDWAGQLPPLLAGQGEVLAELMASLNASELAQRRFREIARVAGLVNQGHPGERRSSRQLQASSALFYDVFRQYDPANPLLRQAERELLADELDIARLQAALARMQASELALQPLRRPTPLAFPLMVARFRERLSNEALADRIARMVQQLERAAQRVAPVADAPASAEQAGPSAPSVAQSLAFGQETHDTPPRPPNAEGAAPERGAGRRDKRARRPRRPSRPLPPL